MTLPCRCWMPRLLTALALTCLLSGTAQAAEEGGAEGTAEWTYMRGPTSQAVGFDTGLVDDFDPAGGPNSNVRWKRADLGGRSTPVLMNGHIFTVLRAEPGTPREGERVVCLDAATGKTVWENRFNVYLSDVPDTRVGWSSVVADPASNQVYVLGVCGVFRCIDAQTGQTRWSIPLHERFGLLSTYGGRTNFPIVYEDLVIVSGVVIGWGEMARPAHRFIALDKNDGRVVWFNGTSPLPDDTTYSAPTIRVIDGQAMMIFGSGDGAVWALQPRTGQPIWQFNLSRRGLNVAPLVTDDRVFMGQSEENLTANTMGAVVAIDPRGKGDITGTNELWRIDQLMVGRSAPVLVDGRLWVIDDRAKLYILDPETGKQIGRRIALGTVMRSTPLVADGKVYATTENGRWYILASDPQQGARILKRGRFPSGEECNASPICGYGRIYIQTSGGLYCLEDPSATHGTLPVPQPAAETPASEDRQPAHVQVVPAEVLMKPGESQTFQVRLFNARGQLLGESNADFTVEGPGQIDADGRFTAPGGAAHQAAIVTAHVGSLTGRARIRIVPDLPWHFDFDGIAIDPARKVGEPPITWVGARYRHVIREVDGTKAMVKITTIPKGTRSRAWFGPSDLHDYTIVADVRADGDPDRLPDIGLIAQGYTFDMMGAAQQLQIRSWDSVLRMARTVDFAWQPNTWYTMKFRASLEDGKGVLRAKVWPRDQAEPEAWTLEAIDEAPVTSGSPGLYGNTKDTEILLDNIRVLPNDRPAITQSS